MPVIYRGPRGAMPVIYGGTEVGKPMPVIYRGPRGAMPVIYGGTEVGKPMPVIYGGTEGVNRCPLSTVGPRG